MTRFRFGGRIAALTIATMMSVALPGMAAGQDLAQMQIQITQLQEQVRQYSGQIEGMQFQITQLQTLMVRMQEDFNQRLGQLEGAPAPAPAQLPGTQDRLTQGTPTVAEPLLGDEDLVEDPAFGDNDSLYASDVFGQPTPDLRGGEPAPLGQTRPSAPLDLSLDGNGNADANAQFRAAYEAVVRGDYAFAEEQFRQYVADYPTSLQAPDATYWLGETLIQRGAHDEAANVLLTGFESYPTSTRAPDLLFKLGTALHGAGEFDTACRTYAEVLRRYPDASTAFREDVTREQARAGC